MKYPYSPRLPTHAPPTFLDRNSSKRVFSNFGFATLSGLPHSVSQLNPQASYPHGHSMAASSTKPSHFRKDAALGQGKEKGEEGLITKPLSLHLPFPLSLKNEKASLPRIPKTASHHVSLAQTVLCHR